MFIKSLPFECSLISAVSIHSGQHDLGYWVRLYLNESAFQSENFCNRNENPLVGKLGQCHMGPTDVKSSPKSKLSRVKQGDIPTAERVPDITHQRTAPQWSLISLWPRSRGKHSVFLSTEHLSSTPHLLLILEFLKVEKTHIDFINWYIVYTRDSRLSYTIHVLFSRNIQSGLK